MKYDAQGRLVVSMSPDYTLNDGAGTSVNTATPGQKKIDLAINALTTETDIDAAADYIAVYDNSASAHRKVLSPVYRNANGVGVGVAPTARNNTSLQLVNGVGFPATQVASSDANTLDDYEEGTFTPAIIGLTSAGTGTYSTQYGAYTKIGRQVTVDIAVEISAHTGTGQMAISGLPFASSSDANRRSSVSIGLSENLTTPAGSIPCGFIPPSSSSQINLFVIPTGGGTLTPLSIDSSFRLFVSATYIV